MRAMQDTHALPNDPEECRRLLLAAYRQAQELQQQVAASQREVETLQHVLDQTADSSPQLQHAHAAKLEELAWYKRWVHGRRRERFAESEGQRHLFDFTPDDGSEEAAADSAEPIQPVAGQTRRRRRRELDLSRLPHHRHELDLSPPEKVCTCCGREKDRIGEDVTRILEYVPSKLEVHEHVRPKYACRYCKDGVSSPPPPERPIARGIAGLGLIAQIVVSKFGDHLPLYARNQWDALRCYTRDGRLSIANNTSERTLRHQAIGRNNWLFLGSANAGPRAAVLYTILAGAKRHRIEPWAYLRELLVRLHANDAQLEELLPNRWAAANPQWILTHRLEDSRTKAAAKRDRRQRRRALAKHRR